MDRMIPSQHSCNICAPCKMPAFFPEARHKGAPCSYLLRREDGIKRVPRPPPPPPSEDSGFLTVCYAVATSPVTDSIMSVIIGLNLVLFTLISEGQEDGMSTFIDVASNVFTAVYSAEAVLKLLGLRPVWYVRPDSQPSPSALSAKSNSDPTGISATPATP